MTKKIYRGSDLWLPFFSCTKSTVESTCLFTRSCSRSHNCHLSLTQDFLIYTKYGLFTKAVSAQPNSNFAVSGHID